MGILRTFNGENIEREAREVANAIPYVYNLKDSIFFILETLRGLVLVLVVLENNLEHENILKKIQDS